MQSDAFLGQPLLHEELWIDTSASSVEASAQPCRISLESCKGEKKNVP